MFVVETPDGAVQSTSLPLARALAVAIAAGRGNPEPPIAAADVPELPPLRAA